MRKTGTQNAIGNSFENADNLAQREATAVELVRKKTGFIPGKRINTSTWWGSGVVGAVHWSGTYRGKTAVLKIQGTRPKSNEMYMIKQFTKANRSHIIRPPGVFAYLDWDGTNKFQAIIMEHISGQKIVQTPPKKGEIDAFCSIYAEYRKNCLGTPWVAKPVEPLERAIPAAFAKWREFSHSVYPHHPSRQKGDGLLVEEAVDVLGAGYAGIDYQFMHGHFSIDDIYYQEKQIVILSNLYWSWRAPLYDSIFAYHWYMIGLCSAQSLSIEEFTLYKQQFLNAISAMVSTAETDTLLKLALLERSAAALQLDMFVADPSRPLTAWYMDDIRLTLRSLIDALTGSGLG